jgi:SAM-dependent methyltransferase
VKRERWNERYSQPGLLWSERPNRFLVAEVSGLAPGRALDLACGEAQNAIWLAQCGWDVVGVDFSDVGIAKGRERAASEGVDVELLVADLLEYEPERAAFDLVLLLYFHLPPDELGGVLDRAAAALTPGGTLLAIGHDRTNIENGVGGPSDPAILYTPDEIAAELTGLEIEKAERVHRDVPDADRPAIDALVRARRAG